MSAIRETIEQLRNDEDDYSVLTEIAERLDALEKLLGDTAYHEVRIQCPRSQQCTIGVLERLDALSEQVREHQIELDAYHEAEGQEPAREAARQECTAPDELMRHSASASESGAVTGGAGDQSSGQPKGDLPHSVASAADHADQLMEWLQEPDLGDGPTELAPEGVALITARDEAVRREAKLDGLRAMLRHWRRTDRMTPQEHFVHTRMTEEVARLEKEANGDD